MENETVTPVSVRGPRRPSPRHKTRGLMQDKRGRWWIDYRTPQERRRREPYGTHDAAKTALAKIDLAKKGPDVYGPSCVADVQGIFRDLPQNREHPQKEPRPRNLA